MRQRHQLEFSASALTSLEECSEASVYAPGHIQPNGVLIVLQEPDLTILQVSENVKQFWGVSAITVVGRSLHRLFSHLQVQQITEFLQQHDLELCNPFELKARSQIFRGTLSRTHQALLLELEPQQSTEKTHSIQFYHRLQSSIFSLRSATSLADLVQRLAQRVKALTGFDRVMIYRLEADEHGVVIAEEKEAHLESYLGLHFPAIDIPVPARKLFLRNCIRQIPNINYTPARLMPTEAFPEEQPLDLSGCILRGVSPYHVEYLQNMGVAGSLTISLIDGQHLWGLMACHHYSPKQVDYETRKTCEFLGQFASLELIHQQQRELSDYQTQVKMIQDKLKPAFLQKPNFILQVLTQNSSSLLHLVHAEGVAIAFDGKISLMGQTPPLEAVQALLSWLSRLNQPEFYFTTCLARPYPPARAFKDTASGILAISIASYQRSSHIVWFRPEQIQTVNWAGNPQDAVTVDELGNMHLCPRKSFELWKQTIQETSLPWQAAEVEAAVMMRNTLMLAVLEFSQMSSEQAVDRAAMPTVPKTSFSTKWVNRSKSEHHQS